MVLPHIHFRTASHSHVQSKIHLYYIQVKIYLVVCIHWVATSEFQVTPRPPFYQPEVTLKPIYK